MPIGASDLEKLLQFGFVIETWDKREDANDDLIGLTKVPFNNLRDAILTHGQNDCIKLKIN